MTQFIGARDVDSDTRIVIFGAPYDGTASFRPGARFGPNAIRLACDGLETYSPAQNEDLDGLNFADRGDIDLGFGAARKSIDAVRTTANEILSNDQIPFMLGGEHSLTAGPVQACLEKYGELTVLQIDAHADLRTDYLGDPDSHACVMNRCVEIGAKLVQFGIRSGTREEWERMRDKTLFSLTDFRDTINALSGPIYITLDIDAFDPSLVPGTGTPEPGGLFWSDFEDIIVAIRSVKPRVVGLDVMELAPSLDTSGVSSVVAAKCVRELLLAI